MLKAFCPRSHLLVLCLLSTVSVFSAETKLQLISLESNDSFVTATTDFIERYVSIQEGHRRKGTEDHIIDQTGEKMIGILLPEDENDNNVYLVLDGKTTLLLSKDLNGFTAYESDIPVYLLISQDTREIFAVYIRLGAEETYLTLFLTWGKDADATAIDPRFQLFGADGKLPVRHESIFVHATLGPVGKFEFPIIHSRSKNCPSTLWTAGLDS